MTYPVKGKQNEDSLIPLENQYLHSQISEQILMWLVQRVQRNDHDSRAKYHRYKKKMKQYPRFLIYELHKIQYHFASEKQTCLYYKHFKSSPVSFYSQNWDSQILSNSILK